MDNLSNASIEDLSQVDEVGTIVANSINEFFSQEQTKDLLKRLKDAGVNMERQKEENEDDRFAGKTFVLRDLGDVKDIIEAGGLFNYAKNNNLDNQN
mgnify:CR=1 FL=1